MRTPLGMHKLTTLTLKLLLLCSTMSIGCSSSSSSKGAEELAARARRVLQTSSQGYVIKPNEDINSYCQGYGIAENSIQISLSTRSQLRTGIEDRYSSMIAEIIKTMNNPTMEGANSLANSALTGTSAVAALFFGICALFSCCILTLWGVFSKCCPKLCCAGKSAPGENRSNLRTPCIFMIVVFSIVTVGLTAVWVTYLAKIVIRVPELKCGTAILYSGLMNGTQVTASTSFVGTNGILFLMGQLQNFINQANNISQTAKQITDLMIAGNVTSMNGNYTQLNSQFNPNLYTYTGAVTPSASIKSSYLLSLPTIISSALGTEVTSLASAGNAVDATAWQIYNFTSNPTLVSQIQSSVTTVQSLANSSMLQTATNYYNKVMHMQPDYMAQVKGSGIFFLIIGISIIILLVVTYIFTLISVTRFKKCFCCINVSKAIMSTLMSTSVAVNTYSAISCIFVIMVYTLCSITNGMVTQQGYLNANLGKFLNNSQLGLVVDTCVFQGGNGNMLAALGFNLNSFNQIANLTSGLQGISNASNNSTLNGSSPIVGGAINSSLYSYMNFSKEDRGSDTNNDYRAGINAFNSFTCQHDQIAESAASTAAGCQAGYQNGTSADSDNTAFGSNYCINLNSLPATKYVSRYSATSQCINLSNPYATAKQYLTDTINSALSYQLMMNSVIMNQTVSDFLSSEQFVYKGLQSSGPKFTSITTMFSGFMATLTNLNSSLNSMIDCRIMQMDISLLENVFCYRFGSDLYNQMTFSLVVGILLLLNSWCMCCGVRIMHKVEEEAKSNPQGDQQAAKAGPNQVQPLEQDSKVMNDRSAMM